MGEYLAILGGHFFILHIPTYQGQYFANGCNLYLANIEKKLGREAQGQRQEG